MIGVVLDRGAVDEHVAAAELVSHPLSGGPNAGVVRHVELDGADVRLAEFSRGPLAARGVARPEHCEITRVRQLAAQLEADAPVRSGHHRHRQIA